MKKNCEVPQCWSTVWLWLGFHENKRRKDLFLLQHTNFYLWSLLFCLLQMNLLYCGIIIILIVPHFYAVILLVSYYQNSCFWRMIVTNNHAQILYTAGCVMAILSEVSSEESFLSWKMPFTWTNTMHSCLHQNNL